jgi:crotonobetaine/carnitine-CoA ligase
MLEPLQVLRLYPPHDGTLASLLASRAAVAPQRPCVVFEEQALTYAEVQAAADRAAALYAARGVRAGDRVGVMSTNHPSTVLTLLALARLGAVMVPVNPDYRAAEAGYVLGHAAVSGVLCSPEALPTVRQAVASISPPPWLLLNGAADAGVPAFDDALAATSAPVPPQMGSPDEPCVFIYTSGTTGFPKGVMHSQRNLVVAGEGFVQRMHLQPDDRLLCILPMFHVNALFYSLAGALAAGATLILVPRFSAGRFWHDVARHRATEANTIAAVSNILLRRPRSEFVPGHTLRKIYGAPFTAETYEVFGREFGVPTLIEGYGMSEIPGVLNNPFAGPHEVGSMGQPSRHPDPAVRLAQVRIVDDDGRDLPDGQTGELWVKTPIVMLGYYRDPEQTAAAFSDGWFRTGDLAWRDADGFYWFVARRKDIIRKRGENISGAELDRVIEAHPQVLQAAAIPVPDPLGEDEILVAVVPKAGATLDAAALASWCRERLAAIKVPRYVAFVDRLPLTPTHRVAKFKLREQADALRARATDLAGPTAGDATRPPGDGPPPAAPAGQ